MTRTAGVSEIVTLIILGSGITGFLILQSYLLVESGAGDTNIVAQRVWFIGLALGGALLAIVVPTADDD